MNDHKRHRHLTASLFSHQIHGAGSHSGFRHGRGLDLCTHTTHRTDCLNGDMRDRYDGVLGFCEITSLDPMPSRPRGELPVRWRQQEPINDTLWYGP